MKRLLAFVLSLVMLLGSIPFTPVHVHAEDVEDLLVAEPVQEPEAAEPEEIVPEETEEVVPEETEEVVPEETEEVVPEETEEVVPEETEEVVPEETEEVIPEETEEVVSEESQETVSVENEDMELLYVSMADVAALAELAKVDNDAVFASYVDSVFFPESNQGRSTTAGDRLSGDMRKMYDGICWLFEQVANGKRTSTEIEIGKGREYNVTFSTSHNINETSLLMAAVLADMVYEHYWFDKTTGWWFGWGGNYAYFGFTVAENYRGSDQFHTNPSITSAAMKSAANARKIVADNAGKNDYEKLVAYNNKICELVEYDFDAVYYGDHAKDNDPWQMIHTFDNDPSTNIVCEGYSKSFKYLCDQSDFDNDSIECYTVTGICGGPHMWNVVSVDSKNYLTDVTNVDGGWPLFMVGGSGSVSGGYNVKGLSYTYDSSDLSLWGTGSSSILKLSGSDYVYTPTCSHSWSSWYQTVAPTCTAKGTERRDCTKCGVYETREAAAKGHSYTEKTIPASCIEYGYVVYTCANCGDTYTDNYKNPLGHDLSKWTVTKAASCVADGEQRRECSRCDFFETQVIPSAGKHNYVPVVTKPTCTAQGYTTYTCGCGDSYVADYVKALGHAWDNGVVTKEPTETTTGILTKTCTRCGATTTEVIPVKEHVHSYSKTVTAPTCTEKGYTTYTCSCGESYVADYVKALGHAWDNGVVTKEPTETTTGILTKTCTRCGATTTEVIPVKEHVHSYSKIVTAPTCTEKGYTTYTCSCGDSYVKDYVSPIGHKYTDKVTEPSCTEGGYTTHVCANCGDTYVDSYTSPKGHAWDEGVVIKRPTDTESGIRVFTCTACGASDEQIIPAGHYEHTYKKTVTAPTYTKKGYTTYTCDVCGESYVDDYVDALGLPKPASVKAKTDPVTGGALLTWEHDGEASCYKVYQATSSKGKYKVVATVTEATATVSVPAGKTYYFKVKAICQDDDSLNSGYSAVVKATGKCGQPQVTAEAGSTGKPVIKWKKVTGAKKYDVYRADTENGKYKKLKTVTTTSYTDTSASGGKTYYYYVKAIASKSTYNSANSEIVSCRTLLAKPALTATVNTATGKPKLTWKKVTGAEFYKIYRAESEDGEFVLLDSQTALTFEDTTAAIDADYWYKVVAVDEADEANNSESSVKKVHATMAKPNVTFASDRVTGKPMLTWNEVEGAIEYKVYRSTSATKSFKVVETIEAGEALEYIDTSVATGKGYYYKVTAVGETTESTSAAKKVYATCSAPVVTAEAGSTGKPVLKWKKVSGATKYDVYRAASENGTYKKLKTVTTTSYTDTTASGGNTYFYKVKALGKTSTLTSNYSEIVSCRTLLAKPALTATVNTATGKPKLTWKKVTGAEFYKIYRAESEDGEFVLLDSQTALTFEDTTAAIDADYWYKVVAVDEADEANNSESSVKKVHATMAKPNVTFASDRVTGKPMLTWDEVEGAIEYKVYRSASATKSFKAVETIEAGETLEYIDTSVATGKGYYYKVTAVGETTESTSAAKKVYATCSAPVVTAEAGSTGKPVLKWKKVSGATKYDVYRATSEDGKYTKVTTTTKLTYTDSKATGGKTYFYKVKALGKTSTLTSNYSEIVSQTCVMAAPTVKASNASGYVKLTWNAVTGAGEYIVFRAPAGSDDFAEYATVEGTSYTDKDMEVGQSYTYCVQAIHASNPEANSILSKPVTCGRKLSAPEVRSEATGNAAAVLLWESDPHAEKYTISQATSKTGTYKKLGTVDVDGQVAMQYFVSVPVGKTYYFKVVANGADKSVDSSATVIAVTGQLGAPTMKKTVDATKNTIKISWNKLSGATGYNIYRRDAYSGDDWEKVGTTTSTSYTNKSVSAGQYEYCVSAYKTVSKKKQEGMKSDPIVTRTMAAPTIDVPQPYDYKIVVYWGEVTGATSYELRYYTNKDSTKRNLGTFTDQYSYTHSVSAGAYYYYQVRGICEENGVTTYGPYVTTPSDMAWGWVHKDGTHKPSFKYILTGNTYSSTYTMVIGIINNGPDTMRFTTSGGKWIDGSSSSYNRSIKLYDYETFDRYDTLKEVSYQEIGPGETGYVIVAVKGSATRYNKNTTIRLGLEYCGKKYGVDFNYYKCTYYAK